MGKKTELGTLLVVLISIFIKIMGGVDLLANETVNYRPETSTSFAKVILTDPNNPEPNPDTCPCEGTGYIIHGDGHKTECPCGPGCDCPIPSGEEEEYIPRHTPLKNFFRGLFRKHSIIRETDNAYRQNSRLN